MSSKKVGMYVVSCEVEDLLTTPDKGLTGPVTFKLSLYNDEDRVVNTNFTLAPLYGCCGVVVSTGSWNKEPSISSSDFHKIKEQIARHLGYSLMLATTQLRNIPEVIGAGKNDWKFVHTFRNKRTDNDLGLMIKDLK